MSPPLPPPSVRRLAIAVRGVVQGVGFRPFVYNTARGLALSGWVCNEADVVRIEVQGPAAAIDAFLDALRHNPPPQARIDAIDIEEMPPLECSEANDAPIVFEIRASGGQAAPRPTIPADLATCPDCLAEINDPAQRRYRYPFTNCTNCGPRWSIIRLLPYDRPRTSMAAFVMCPACQAEYDNPADRRFHAQPIACPNCGPKLQLLDNQGRGLAAGDAALSAAVASLLTGRILALKGLGGFQLLADATNAEAVALLRRRKRGPDRPFALMLPTLDDVRRHCAVSEEEARTLTSSQAPIVLLRRRAGDGDESSCLPQAGKNACPTGPLPSPLSPLPSLSTSPLSPLSSLPLPPVESVAPGNPYLGVMLPYTPLHHLLMQACGRPIVCTSGNLSEEPMATTTDDALRRLGAIADLVLTHNRPIVRPVDDSIVRVGADGVQVLRRARGFAPLPLEIACERKGRGDVPAILAVGGHLKNTVALSFGNRTHHAPRDEVHHTEHVKHAEIHHAERDEYIKAQLVPVVIERPHRRSGQRVERRGVSPGDRRLAGLLPSQAPRRGLRPTSRLRLDAARRGAAGAARRAAAARAAPPRPRRRLHGRTRFERSGAWLRMGRHRLWPGWHGLGRRDAAVRRRELPREAHLRTFSLPGGDRAMREPRRSAFGLLHEIFKDKAAECAAAWFTAAETTSLLSMLNRRVNTPRTSSMGRLFDAVAALCGLPPVISFEGQAAMALEFAAEGPRQDSLCDSFWGGTSLSGAKGVGNRQTTPFASLRDVPPHESTCSRATSKENEPEAYQFALSDTTPIVIDWEPVVRAVLADRAAGVPVGRISGRFHAALAEMAVAVAGRVGCPQVALCGGCFQNALLADGVRKRLSAAGHRVYTALRVPPGDGGIALGQIYVALQHLQGP